MAEARSAVNYRVEKATLLFQVTEEEIVLRINRNVIPWTVTRAKRSLVRYAYRTRNALVNAFYPAPPLEWGLLVTAPAALMLSVAPDTPQGELSIMLGLLKPVSDRLWSLETHIPPFISDSQLFTAPATATIAKAVLISTSLGTGFTLALAHVRRILLTALLGYQGWIYDEPKKTSTKTIIWGVSESLPPFSSLSSLPPPPFSSVMEKRRMAHHPMFGD